MARSRALPLPDAAVRLILSRIDDLRMTFPPSRGTRPFLAAFLRLVYDATGQVYGAGTMRKLLQLYAPEYRPSTVTLHDEIVAFRESQAYRRGARQADSNAPTESPSPTEESGLLAGIHRMLSMGVLTPSAESDNALVQAIQAENDRLRALNAQLENGLKEAHKENARLQALAVAHKTEALAKSEALEKMTSKVEQLAQAVQAAQEQVAASHRFALGRIEDAGTETRQVREQLRAAHKTIDNLRKRLSDEQVMTAALQQALNAERSRL